MFLPATLALMDGDEASARAFLYAGALGLFVIGLIRLSLNAPGQARRDMVQLLTLFAAFAVLPLYLAIPFHESLRTTTFFNAYMTMVSSMTTTGMDLYQDPDRLSPALHVWLAQVAWLGGLLMWVAAGAVLAPMSLGGFEVTARGEPGRSDPGIGAMTRADPDKRLRHIAARLIPVYTGLTGALFVLLLLAGDAPLTALCHAMSVLASSGLSPVGGLEGAQSGRLGEFVIFGFMIFALSRVTFSSDTSVVGSRRLVRDPELAAAVLIVVAVTLALFMRHWVGVLDLSSTGGPTDALRALWGSVFTVLSFLSTTGFVSNDWVAASGWSGLSTSGMILMGLALIGGGVATTAGGVKLIRVYALYLNGLRELERLVYPSSVNSASRRQKRLQKNGAFIAWIAFMLFAMSFAAVMLLLAAFGIEFEQAIILAVASLSTTGPLVDAAAGQEIPLLSLSGGAKAVLCAAMIIGRLETLAIVALLTPELWRK